MPTSRERKTVLVAGATGRLGVVVELLLARGHAVRALTRDPDSDAAQRLRSIGAEVRYGDFEDPASIEAAAVAADALFATGTAHKAGPQGEERHGRNIAVAAAAADVGQLVYGSGNGAAHDRPLLLFQAKFRVEEHIRALTATLSSVIGRELKAEQVPAEELAPGLRGHVPDSAAGHPVKRSAERNTEAPDERTWHPTAGNGGRADL